MTAPIALRGTVKDVVQNKRSYVINTDKGSLGIDFSGASGKRMLMVWKGGLPPESGWSRKSLINYLKTHGMKEKYNQWETPWRSWSVWLKR